MKEIEIDIIDREEISFNVDNSVVKVYPNLENLEITPSKEEQTFKSENYYGYDEVTVNRVTNEIDKNIKPENIKEGTNILGVSGIANILNGEELTITKNGEYTPTEPINAYTKVIANVPNHTSDATAKAEDIARGKTAYISSGLVEGTGTISTPIEKGIVINSYDEDGFPTDVSVVGLTEILSNHFRYTMFSSVIGGGIFHKAGSNFHLPGNLKKIGNYAFDNCSTLNLTELPDEITDIGEYAFQLCSSLELEHLPSGLTKLFKYTFYGCSSLALTKLPNNITEIGSYTFRSCIKLALTELPSALTTIQDFAFYDCEKITIKELPEGLTLIKQYAFQNCKNITVKSVPSGITILYDAVFRSCINISEMTCLGDITKVSGNSFYGCTNLTKFVLPNVTKVPTLSNTNAFANTPIANGTGYIYLPEELVETAKSSSNWSVYASQIKGVSEL